MSGSTELQIADEFFGTWCQYHRSFSRYVDLRREPRLRTTLGVYVLWGPAGTGKTRFSRDFAVRLGLSFWISSYSNLQWFDGYGGESVAIIDDFRGRCEYDTLLRVLDIYELRVPIKGGSVAWIPDKIFITSNTTPCEWYRDIDYAPLHRRFKEILRVGESNDEWDVRFDFLRNELRLNE
jgi:hypothetical protein